MTSTTRPDGGDHTALEDPATKWPRCVGTGGRDASESVAAIVGMRSYRRSRRGFDRMQTIRREFTRIGRIIRR